MGVKSNIPHAVLATVVVSVAPFAIAAYPTTNPSLPISREAAAAELRGVAATRPVRLARPVVILGGFLDIGIGPTLYAHALEPITEGPIVTISFADCGTFAACRQRVVDILERRLGKGPAGQTVEVDVIGQSMGGLVAVFSALADPTLGTRLNVHRLFTISSPLQGAIRAALEPPALDALPLVHDMRPGSTLYQRLASAKVDYSLFSYTRLDDQTVGEQYAALAAHGVWWVDNPPGERAHTGAFGDPRIVLDIVRRLRNEPPIATEPPAPLPTTRP